VELDSFAARAAGPVTLCGSLSLHPVRLGATMHAAAYRAAGLSWAYVPFAMTSASLPQALVGMRALGIRGFGVSMPFKIEVLPYCDRLAPLAAEIGAVNTIVNDDGTLVGHNTDALGAVAALEEVTPVRGKRCVVIGAGGAARAVVHGLAAAGAIVSVTNRTAEKAADLAAHAGVSAVAWGDVARGAGDADVLVNASSAGMNGSAGDTPVIDVAGLDAGVVVMDIVYKPITTALVHAARARGLRAIDGSRMLLHQAGKQFELYTGMAAPLEAMDEALRAGLDAG
jgi:shikimate dehydrogenase